MKGKKILQEVQALRTDVKRLVVAISAKNETIDLLRDEVEELRGDRSKLMDRIMSRNWETFRTYSPSENVPGTEVQPPPPEADELNAGEILDIQ